MNKDKLVERLLSFLESCTEITADDKPHTETAIVKSVDNMQKRAMFVVLEPQGDDGTTSDLHADWYSEDDIYDAMVSFNIQCRKAGLDHEGLLSDDDVVIEQSYIAPCDFSIEETGEVVKKGTWLQVWKFKNDELWSGVLDGTYTGLSVECSAMAYEVK